jgi:hypothetical protein
MSGNPTAAQWLGIDKLHRVGGYALPTLIDKLDLPSPLGWQQRQEACSRTRESLKYSEVPRVRELAKHARHQPVYETQDASPYPTCRLINENTFAFAPPPQIDSAQILTFFLLCLLIISSGNVSEWHYVVVHSQIF